MCRARRVLLQNGDAITTHRECVHQDEVAGADFEIVPGSTCAVCGRWIIEDLD